MKRYVVSIDQSTQSTKGFLFDAAGAVVRQESRAHAQFYPGAGRAEHDAEEIYRNVAQIFEEITRDAALSDAAALALTNQRETTAVWDRETGLPVCRAIVWQDVRGEAICRELAQKAEFVRAATGLPLSPYYPAAKLAALFRERPDLDARARAGGLCAGTVETYLIYRLTGGRVFATDATNASRTQLYNLKTGAWDADLLSLFDLPRALFADSIRPCDAPFGAYRGVPILCAIGDSHAALYAQGCHAPGGAKATYGTGSSVMMNVGTSPVLSCAGLSASVAYQRGGAIYYALEGNVTHCADTLVWLVRDLGLFRDEDEIERLAAGAAPSSDVALVPAFSGLGAPYFDAGAQALICNLTRASGRAEIARAALESIAHQDADVLETMRAACGAPLDELAADGGPTKNALLMQMQADLAGCRVRVSRVEDASALGAALLAGQAAGLYASFEAVASRLSGDACYRPRLDASARNASRAVWRAAVDKARR